MDTEEPTTQPAEAPPQRMPLARKGPFAKGEKIPQATWLEVERDCVAGMTVPEASLKWVIKENTIRVKAKRDGWVMPGRVRDVLRRHDVSAMTAAVQGATKDWLAEGEKHREKVFDIATNSLKTVKKIKVKNAKDFEIVDKAARRAAGLETADTQVSVLLQLNERMENFADEQPIEATEVDRQTDTQEIEAGLPVIEAELVPDEPSTPA